MADPALIKAISEAMGEDAPLSTLAGATEEPTPVASETPKPEPDGAAVTEDGATSDEQAATAPAANPPAEDTKQTKDEASSPPEKDASDYIVHRLNAEEKALLEGLQPEAQDVVRRVLARQDAAHTRRTQQVNEERKAFASIDEAIAHKRAEWRQVPGLTDAQALRNLIAVEDQFLKDPGGTIKWLAKSYNVDLNALVGRPAAQPAEADASQPIPHNPQIDAIIPRFEALERNWTTFEQKQRQTAEQQVASEIAAFQASHPMKDYFPLIEADVVAEIHKIAAADPTMDRKAMLAEAYDRAIWGNPQTRAIAIQAQQQKVEGERAAAEAGRVAKAKRAASGVRQTSQPGKALPGNDLRDIVSKSMEECGF